MIYNRLIVAAIGFIRLEPYDGKLSRTVLRGGKDSNALLLPDYASVEMLYHPEYVGKPLAVGGDSEARHGIVLTANYIAKRSGVKTGMALWQAKQVCPDLIFVPPRMDLYLKFSSMLREIYSEYTNQVEPYGCDEAWLDVTDSFSLKGDGRKIAEEINRRVKKELGITVSIGISWNKIFAKLPANVEEIADKEESKNLPSFGVVATIILIPLVLILLSTASDYIPMAESIKSVLGFLGEPFVALTIATLVAMYFLGTRQGYNKGQLKKILDHSLRPVGMILLVIASGGVIRWMLQDSGLGNIIGPALEQSGMPLIIVAFLIAFLVRASVGSSIVAMTMASGIMATMPATADCSMLYKAAMCCAICGGATALSHVNDAGFWLVGTFLEIDEKTTLKSWTVMETLIGITGLVLALIISIFA